MNDRIDLTPLDPDRDPAWRRHLVQGVMARVAGRAPARRRYDTVDELLRIARPALLAASVIAVAALLGRRERHRSADIAPQFAVAEAMGLSGPLAGWVEQGRTPTAAEVLAALRGY
jgi:hypothetical protein